MFQRKNTGTRPNFFSYFILSLKKACNNGIFRRGVVVITAAQLRSTKSEHGFYAGSNPARGVSEICDDENL